MRSTRTRARLAILCALSAALAVAGAALAGEGDAAVLWPEAQREFLLDGGGLLLDGEAREALVAAPAAERERRIETFLGLDPIPETPENELRTGIERRRRLVRQEFLSFFDDRARVLFLQGQPTERKVVECGQTFNPLEVWTYLEGESSRRILFYRPAVGRPFRLWLPLDSKRALYNHEMEYWLEQWESLRGRLIARRFDLQICPEASLVDDVTGVAGLHGFRSDRPGNSEIRRLLEPPADLAEWARRAAATRLAPAPVEIPVEKLEIFFTDRLRQRLVGRFLLELPPGAPLEPLVGPVGDDGADPADEAVPTEDGEERQELRLALEGVIEQEGEIFEEFRVRFKLRPPEEGVAIALAFDRSLRPHRSYLLRLRLRDETGGAEVTLAHGFQVPAEPEGEAELPQPERAVLALAEQLTAMRIRGADSLLLAPPDRDVVLGFWRAEALVSGSRIRKVVFLLDGEPQLTRTGRPFSAELRLAQFPTEQVVRAEGFDENGDLVAADEVVLNQPRGALRVAIVAPARNADVSGRVTARAEIVVPEDRTVERVEFRVGDQVQATLMRPPWRAEIEVPESDEVSYLTVEALLDDGTRAEEVRFLNAPRYLEELEVNLVELLTTVVDRSRRPVSDLEAEDFEVLEDGRAQRVTKFERVDDLPLTVGITIDTSTSMGSALHEAQKAAVAFLEDVMTPRDRAFAVSFSGEPVLLIPPTDDVAAVEAALRDLHSVGWTALHDAVVTSLYLFRGMRGQRALVVLSDGDDSASRYQFRDALEYARRSGVVIYTIGLGVGTMKLGIKRKLTELAEETGGLAFFIQRAEELAGVYDRIEAELRSQYLLAYATEGRGEAFREVEVKVRKGGLKARTIRGYYP